jgi:hypothetical protein
VWRSGPWAHSAPRERVAPSLGDLRRWADVTNLRLPSHPGPLASVDALTITGLRESCDLCRPAAQERHCCPMSGVRRFAALALVGITHSRVLAATTGPTRRARTPHRREGPRWKMPSDRSTHRDRAAGVTVGTAISLSAAGVPKLWIRLSTTRIHSPT